MIPGTANIYSYLHGPCGDDHSIRESFWFVSTLTCRKWENVYLVISRASSSSRRVKPQHHPVATDRQTESQIDRWIKKDVMNHWFVNFIICSWTIIASVMTSHRPPSIIHPPHHQKSSWTRGRCYTQQYFCIFIRGNDISNTFTVTRQSVTQPFTFGVLWSIYLSGIPTHAEVFHLICCSLNDQPTAYSPLLDSSRCCWWWGWPTAVRFIFCAHGKGKQHTPSHKRGTITDDDRRVPKGRHMFNYTADKESVYTCKWTANELFILCGT